MNAKSFLRKLSRRIQARVRKRSFSLNEIDRKLQRRLGYRGGFFIEAGANDGVNQSNTLYFERYYGWRGLLVEPIPELAERCRRNRPRSIVENCALVSFNHHLDHVEMEYCGLMSLVKGSLGSKVEEDRLRRGMEVQSSVTSTYSVTVPARTLTSVVDRHAISRIDLLSLDVEGYEVEVLKGIDFERVRPEYALIETARREEVEALLSPVYVAIEELSHHDILYRHR